MGRKKLSTNETRIQVPLKDPIHEKLVKKAGDLPIGRVAAGIITEHFKPARRK